MLGSLVTIVYTLRRKVLLGGPGLSRGLTCARRLPGRGLSAEHLPQSLLAVFVPPYSIGVIPVFRTA